MTIQVKKNSRLRFADLLLIDGIEFWDVVEFPEIVEQVDDLIYSVKGNDRMDTLASRFYGDAVLWWVIAVANGMEIVPTQLNEGATLRIPSRRYVSQELFKNARVR